MVDEVVRLLFAQGGIVGGYAVLPAGDKTLVGLFGYFRGQPTQNFADRHIGFVYIAGVAKAYRRTGAFRNGVFRLAETLKLEGVTEMRCHAREDDAYTNGIYSRLGPAIDQEKNRRGDLCIIHANSAENVLALTASRRRVPPTLDLAIAG